jgi:hypothetical protein
MIIKAMEKREEKTHEKRRERGKAQSELGDKLRWAAALDAF